MQKNEKQKGKNEYYHSFGYSLAEIPGTSFLLLKMSVTLKAVLQCLAAGYVLGSHYDDN